MLTVLLLVISNTFMTAAWYGHLKYRDAPLVTVIVVSWMIASVEYAFQVPANREPCAGVRVAVRCRGGSVLETVDSGSGSACTDSPRRTGNYRRRGRAASRAPNVPCAWVGP
jgi:hypothetical protein